MDNQQINLEEQKLLLDALEDPRVLSRRGALRNGSAWGAGLALASMPVAMAALAKRAFAQGGLPSTVVNVLNFALLLEYLEDEFYRIGLGTPGLIPPEVREVFERISEDETSHVAFLRAVLGPEATPKPEFDYTANGAFPDVFTNYQTFATVAQAFEDTGVRAYKGQAPKLYDAGSALILTAALRIHSVEARHASAVRRLSASPAEEGWIPFNQPNAIPAIQGAYAGEENIVHAGIDAVAAVTDEGLLAAVTPEQLRELVTEAFDEPLSLREVYQIVSPFGTANR